EQVGWDVGRRHFVDTHNRPIRRMFKLYPWEWMLRDDFGQFVPTARTRWLEPPWKMILSCKSILPLLYDRFPDSPYLVPASFDPQRLVPLRTFDGRYPVLGTWHVNGKACGLGIREDDSPITRNTSRFVPHCMVS